MLWTDTLDYKSMAAAIESFSGLLCTPEKAKSVVISIVFKDPRFEKLDLEGSMLLLNSHLNNKYATIPSLSILPPKFKGDPPCSRNSRRLKKKTNK